MMGHERPTINATEERTAMESHEFGQRLRAWRCQLNLTQGELAERSKVPRPALSAYERGHSSPTMGTAAKLAAGLGLEGVGDLFGPTPTETAEAVSKRSARRGGEVAS